MFKFRLKDISSRQIVCAGKKHYDVKNHGSNKNNKNIGFLKGRELL
jgi:hypothetical protein